MKLEPKKEELTYPNYVGSYVVYNECMIGVYRESPNFKKIEVVHGSILKGYSGPEYGTILIGPKDIVRPATKADEERFCILIHEDNLYHAED